MGAGSIPSGLLSPPSDLCCICKVGYDEETPHACARYPSDAQLRSTRMSQPRKTLTQHAAEIEQWIAQGWLTGQETFIELQDMATMTDLIYQEAARSADVQAEIFGIKGRFQEVLAPLMRRDAPLTILEALTPILEEHPGMWPGMALYWLRRQSA